MVVTIKDKEYNIKNTLRSIFIFENITGKKFNIETTLDEFIYFYAILAGSNQYLDLTFDDFITIVDEDPTVLNKINEYLKKQADINNQLENKNESSDGEKN